MSKQTISFTLDTRLSHLSSTLVAVDRGDGDPAQQKKRARIQFSVDNTSSKIGFLHAVMARIGDGYFLISGGSGVGKSTIAQYLVDRVGAEIVANDWVAVEKQGDQFLASDVNYSKDIKHEAACPLSGIIFLTKTDELRRDAYVPTEQDLAELLHDAFDGMSEHYQQVLSSFWLAAKKVLPFHCVVPTRHASEHYVGGTVLMVLHRSRPIDEAIEVGVIGVGAVGTILAAELAQLPFVTKVHLFGRDREKIVGYSLDLNQALYKGRSNMFVAHDSVEDLYRRSSVVFMCFRDSKAEADKSRIERWQRVAPHVALLKEYCEVACRVNFMGTVFMVTNPVDYLTYAHYELSQAYDNRMRTFQFYGAGLECDIARAIFYAKRYTPTLDRDDIDIFGSHEDDFVISSPLAAKKAALLHRDVVKASEAIRSHGDIRTTYGPIAGVVRSYRAFVEGSSAYVTVLQNGAYMGRNTCFAYGLPVNCPVNSHPDYQTLVKDNHKKVANNQYLLYDI